MKPVIIIPSYNTGSILLTTLQDALATNFPVLLVFDGSTDNSNQMVRNSEIGNHQNLEILSLTKNQGKGKAVLQGAIHALNLDYTHFISMDADGQHNAQDIPDMVKLAENQKDSIVMGCPVFGSEAPWARVWGRKITIGMTSLETLFCGLGDTLFGMRVYPLDRFVKVMKKMKFGQGYDFDPEIAVRMVWDGCRPIQYQTKVRYVALDEGGVSHFHYLRDNLKLTFLHFRLIPELLIRLLFNKHAMNRL